MKKQTMLLWSMRALIGASLLGMGLMPAQAQPPQTNSPAASTNSAPVKAQARAAERPALKKQLTGAELYSINCERCHQERYPTERTGAQWKTIMLHMQVRANIPVSQAKLILQYLQENSGR